MLELMHLIGSSHRDFFRSPTLILSPCQSRRGTIAALDINSKGCNHPGVDIHTYKIPHYRH